MSRYTDRAEYYKKLKRCTKCGKQDAQTLIGKPLCFECNERNKKYSREHYRRKGNPSSKIRYEYLKEKGICVDCGKRKAKIGRVRCEICLNKNNKANTKSMISREDVRYMNLFYLCCKKPVVKGYNLCENCLSKAKHNIKIAQYVVNKNKIYKKIQKGEYMQKYDNSKMEKCEYIEAMKKVYFKEPKQENGKCYGIKNKYSNDYSTHCLNCLHLKKEE